MPETKEPLKKKNESEIEKSSGSGLFQINLQSANDNKKDEKTDFKASPTATGLFGNLENQPNGDKKNENKVKMINKVFYFRQYKQHIIIFSGYERRR